MLLGRVSGEVWGARQAQNLGGHKLLIVDVLTARPDGSARDQPAGRVSAHDLLPGRRQLVAIDGLGAGVGELVLVAHGTRSRDLTYGPTVPTKEVVIAIVDDGDLILGGRGGRR